MAGSAEFGFVTMGTTEGARAALDALNRADMRGRRLVVNIAHPKGEGPLPAGDGPTPRPTPRWPQPWIRRRPRHS